MRTVICFIALVATLGLTFGCSPEIATASSPTFAEWYAVPENRDWYHFNEWYSASPRNASYYHIRDMFGTGRLGDEALAVAQCESKLNPRAKSPTNDHGVFQINLPSWQRRFPQVTGYAWSPNVYHASVNARFARWLYDQSGWQPWACRKVL